MQIRACGSNQDFLDGGVVANEETIEIKGP